MITEVRRLLAASSGGGVVEGQTRLDRAHLAAVAAEHGARFAELRGPSSKAELLEALRDALELPRYMGSNWDALEEVLAYPEPGGAGPTLLAWYDPQRLPAGDAATFRDIVKAAGRVRASTNDGALVVVTGPSSRAQR
jgi:barstar (barnase inhibitor)